jgi:hypothetical protein
LVTLLDVSAVKPVMVVLPRLRLPLSNLSGIFPARWLRSNKIVFYYSRLSLASFLILLVVDVHRFGFVQELQNRAANPLKKVGKGVP